MILELFLKPVTGTKKLINTISNNLLIGLSIAIPLLIALIPALVIKQSISSILKPVQSISSLFGDNIGQGTATITSSILTYIFKFVFVRILLVTILITLLLFAALIIYYNLKKIVINPLLIWKSMTVSGIQIVFYFIIGGLLSFLSAMFFIIFFFGIINSIISLHECLYEYTNAENYFSVNEENVQTIQNVQVQESTLLNQQISETQIVNQDIATNNQVPVIFNYDTAQSIPSIPIGEKMKALTKKQKTVFISVASVIVAVIILIVVGNSFTSKEYVSKKLVQAVKDNNTSEMAKYIIASDPRFKVNKDSLKGFSDYLKDNPAYTSELLKDIDEQSKNDDDKNLGSLIKLTTSGKKFLFFKNYVYQLPVYFVKVQTEYKNTKVSFNNKLIYTTDSDNESKECGPYLPGKYTLDANLKTDYAEVKGHSDLTLQPTGLSSDVVETDLRLDGEKLELYSDYKDAKIIINGKDTGVSVKDVDTLPVIPNDGTCKIQLSNQFPWGSMKTEENIFGKDSMNLSFDKNNSALIDAVKPAIADFTKSFVAAYQALDPSKLTSCSDEYKQALTNEINSIKSSGGSAAGTVTSIIVDPQTLSLQSSGADSNSYTVSVNGTYNSDFAVGATPYFADNAFNISLVYDTAQNKWLVENVSSNWFSDKITNGTEITIK